MSRQHPDAKPPFRQPDSAPGERPRCRWCWGPVGKGRQSWCGDACVEEYRSLHDWNLIRGRVHKRDRGVCGTCGVDLDKIARIRKWERHWNYRMNVSSAWGEDAWVWPGDTTWEADHIQARHLGGDNTLTNLRTLCRACHKAVTARQARERAQTRRVAKDRHNEPAGNGEPPRAVQAMVAKVEQAIKNNTEAKATWDIKGAACG